jgi:hypothetical protein
MAAFSIARLEPPSGAALPHEDRADITLEDLPEVFVVLVRSAERGKVVVTS